MLRHSPLYARLRRYLAALAILTPAVLVSSGTSHAGSPTETAGIRRFEDGKKAFDAGQFETALPAFQESLSMLPSPNTRLYIGRCFRALNKPASAFTAFRQAAREASDRMRATDEKRFKATRDTATSEAAEIEAKVPRLTLAVPSDAPEGTVVKLNDGDLPRAAWGTAVETDPGKYHVTATGPRRQSFDKTVELHEGEQLKLDVQVPRLPTGVIALRFSSKPGGLEVQLDGVPVDQSEWNRLREVDTGEHKVTVKAPGYEDFLWAKPVGDGEKAEVDVTLVPVKMVAPPPGGGTPKWLFFTVAGVAVVSVGVATVLAVSAKSKSTDQKSLDPLQRDPDTQSKIRSLSGDANILFIAGSALAVGTGVLFFTTDWKGKPSETTTGASFRPFLTPTAGGLAASGRF